MSSLSDSIALSARVQADKEYEERRKKELDELWESGTKEQQDFAQKVVKLVLRAN